jgi:hypothetical protein
MNEVDKSNELYLVINTCQSENFPGKNSHELTPYQYRVIDALTPRGEFFRIQNPETGETYFHLSDVPDFGKRLLTLQERGWTIYGQRPSSFHLEKKDMRGKTIPLNIGGDVQIFEDIVPFSLEYNLLCSLGLNIQFKRKETVH